jgi:hypothetical protein
MGNTDVAALIESWLDSPHVKWELTRDVVEWARGYGTDLKRAWEECPRADYLLAIAGACQAPEEPVVLGIAAAAREALRFVPRNEGRSFRAVLYSEGYRHGRPLDQKAAQKVPDEGMAVLNELNARAEAAERARAELAGRIRPAWSRITGAAIHEALQAADSMGVAAADAGPFVAAFVVDAMWKGIRVDKEMRLFRPREEEPRRLLASAHAARAAASAANVAASADIAFNSLVLLGRLNRKGLRPEDRESVVQLSEIAHRSGARVYTDAALVALHAADAIGLGDALEDAAWERGLRVYLEGIAAELQASEPATAAPTKAMRATFAAIAEEAKLAKLASYAETLRARIPFSALRPPGKEKEHPDPAKDPRGALRSSLAGLRPLAGLLGEPEVTEALDTALAILELPGALDRQRLLPVMRTIHERMVGLFERGASETEGPLRDKLRASAEAARKDADRFERMLDEIGSSEVS